MTIEFNWKKDTKNYALYEQPDGINRLYLPKGLPRIITVTVTGQD